MNRFINVTPSLCIGCRSCEIVCALAHAQPEASVAAPDPDASDVLAGLGHLPRLKVVKGDNVCMPVTCHHCDDAPCAAACPTAAIRFVQDTVQVEPEKCIGCKSCMIACPYGMIDVVARPAARAFAGMRLATGETARAQKCDLCVDRSRGPACIEACPTHALWLANEDAIRAIMHACQEQAVKATVAAAANG